MAAARSLARLQHRASPPWLHAEVARRMAERLDFILREPRQVVVWSGVVGDGTQALAQRYPRARCLSVEADGVAPAPPPRWWQRQGLLGLPQPQPVAARSAELLWSNLLMHLVADPDALLARWRQALAVDGFVMWSTFGPQTLRQLRALYRDHAWGSPGAALTDMHDWGDAMVRAGFADPVMDQETLTLTWPDAESLLVELRELGANFDTARMAGLRTPRWRQRLLEALRNGAGPGGRVAMEFEIVYGHAFNPAPRAAVAAHTEVALDDMRQLLRRPRDSTR